MTPLPSDTELAPDDLYLIVMLWQRRNTREVALELADRNRRASRVAPPSPGKDAL
jgi:hypothetical protein